MMLDDDPVLLDDELDLGPDDEIPAEPEEIRAAIRALADRNAEINRKLVELKQKRGSPSMLSTYHWRQREDLYAELAENGAERRKLQAELPVALARNDARKLGIPDPDDAIGLLAAALGALEAVKKRHGYEILTEGERLAVNLIQKFLNNHG